MEETSGKIVYPTIEQVIDINRRMIDKFGGLFLGDDNLLNRSALEYILEAISSTIFGIELYTTLKEKACAITYAIILNHVFNDGNKRTGVQVAVTFLESNNVEVNLDDSIVDLAAEVAAGTKNYNDLLEWYYAH